MQKTRLKLIAAAVAALTSLGSFMGQANAAMTGNWAVGAGVASYNGNSTPNITGITLTSFGSAPWVPSTLFTGYLALTPGGIEYGPGYDFYFPLGYQNFVATITHTFYVPTAGTYNFGLFSDDGSAMYIDSSLVVNNGGEHAPAAVFNSTYLTAGSHSMLVEYYEGAPLFQANLTAYMDVAVPEPSTYLAGALLALVFGVQGFRSLRSRKQTA